MVDCRYRFDEGDTELHSINFEEVDNESGRVLYSKDYLRLVVLAGSRRKV